MKHWSYKKMLKKNKWHPRYEYIPWISSFARLSALSKKCTINKFQVSDISTKGVYKVKVNPNDEIGICLLNYNEFSINYISSAVKYLNILSTNYEFSDFFTGGRRRIICTKSYETISNDIDFSNLTEEEYFQYSTLYDNLDDLVKLNTLFKCIEEKTKDKFTLMNFLRGIQKFEAEQ